MITILFYHKYSKKITVVLGSLRYQILKAESVGFEPTRGFKTPTSLAVRRFRPLSQLSKYYLFLLFLHEIELLSKLQKHQNKLALRHD
jgi:hypothetical protein